jgi:hypothetical protein
MSLCLRLYIKKGQKILKIHTFFTEFWNAGEFILFYFGEKWRLHFSHACFLSSRFLFLFLK